MDVTAQLEEIINLLKDTSFSNYIAIFSLVVSVIALLANIITNIKNNKHYIESLKPLLSFDFYEMNDILLLAIKNNGKSEAKNIKIKVLNIKNNGKHNQLDLDGLFNSEFVLYPTEEVQGIVAYSDNSLDEDFCPIIDVEVSFINGINGKLTEYIRTIAFRRNIYDGNGLSKIEDSIESISYSNNRLANYIEGRTLFRVDKLNVFPHNSLYKDMKDAFNNIEREEKEDTKS